jgi:hypothetical protein
MADERITSRPDENPAMCGRRASGARAGERGATLIEYVGLGAVSAMLVTGVAAALDSTIGERFGSIVVAKLLEAISGS